MSHLSTMFASSVLLAALAFSQGCSAPPEAADDDSSAAAATTSTSTAAEAEAMSIQKYAVCEVLATAAAATTGATVYLAAATGGCAGGMLVTLGAGEPLCLIPAAGTVVAGLAALTVGATAWLLCSAASKTGPIRIDVPITIPRPQMKDTTGKCRCSLSESKASTGNKPSHCPDRLDLGTFSYRNQAGCVAAGNAAAASLGCGGWVKHCNVSP